MKLIRNIALLAGVFMLMTACNKDADELTTSVKANTNPLLAHVPADTTYVFAALESTPEDVVDAYLTRFQPVLEVMSEHIRQFQADYAAGNFEDYEGATLGAAILDELDGELNTANLEKLGISMKAPHAFYATGLFPVIRVGINDAGALRAAIGRIQAKTGWEIPELNLNGTNYWRISEGDMPVGVYIAILDTQLAMSVFPVNAEDKLLAAFLGQDMPAQSLASTNALAIMNKQKGYTAYGSGYLNLSKLADELLNTDSQTYSYLGQEMDFGPDDLEPVCIEEIKSIVAKAPRMTAGTTVLTANEFGMRYEIEIENTLAGNLAALVSDVAAAEEGDYLFSAALALKVGKLRSFVLEQALAVTTAPFECQNLSELNQNATELVNQLNIPMPPMVNNLLGARVRLDDFDPTSSLPMGEGLVTLHVDKPEMFIGTASMFIPGFDALDLANQSEPVKIPNELMYIKVDDLEVHALMGKQAIGVSVGEKHSSDLGDFMAAEPKQDGTFLSISYDMARQLEIQSGVAEKWGVDMDDHPSGVHEFSEAFEQSYKAMLGRSRVEMKLTGDGLLIDSMMTFK